MNILTSFFITLVLLLGILILIIIRSPSKLWLKGASLVLAVLLIVVMYVGGLEALGKPKPSTYEWLLQQTEKVEVIGAKIIEGKGIYVYLNFPEPRSYVIPWDLKTALQLQRAMQQGIESKGEKKVMMKNPFKHRGFGEDKGGEPSIWAEPQPALPPKSTN